MHGPPPTVPEEDAYRRRSDHVHRRDSEAEVRRHQRWYDSTKAQLTLLATALGLLAGAVAFGYSFRDIIRTVESTESRWQAHMQIESQQWEAINRNTSEIANLTDKMDEVIRVVNETRCFVRAQTRAEHEECVRQSARPLQPTRRNP